MTLNLVKRNNRSGALIPSSLKHTLLLSIFVGFMASCASNSQEITFTNISGVPANAFCLFEESKWETGALVIFRNATELNRLRHCFTDLPSFDFSRHSLIAVFVRGEGWDFDNLVTQAVLGEYASTLTIYVETTKMFLYRTYLHFLVGSCTGVGKGFINTHWIKVDSLPDGYRVIVKINESKAFITPTP